MPNTFRPDNDQRSTDEGRARNLTERVADGIRRHTAGDRQAMTDLIRIVSPWLHAVARGVGLSGHSAEDVVQTTLLALVRNVDSIRSPDAGVAWLRVTARREAIKVARAESAVDLIGDSELAVAYPSESEPEAITMDLLSRKLLWRHVAALPERGQLILNEIAFGDRPDYSGFSGRSGMPVGSIGPTRQRSLLRLRRLLESDPRWRVCA